MPATVPGADQPALDERWAPGTGHRDVDAALAALDRAATAPPEQQVSAYEAAHQALRRTLATIDQAD